jgi:phenylalanyl-tRNA synthetase alpha chain
MPFFEEVHSDTELLRTDEKQETHTTATAKLLETELKKTLEHLCQAIFNGAEPEGGIQMRWEPTYFPFTHPSFELQVLFEDKWLEVCMGLL